MKGGTVSLNRIYGDSQFLAIKNRLQYIKTRQDKVRTPFAITRSHEKNTTYEQPTQQKFIHNNMVTECHQPSTYREISSVRKERQQKLRQMRSMQYLQAKQNSQKNKMRIAQSKNRELLLKKIKRKKIRFQEQQGRARLQAYEEDKLRSLRNTKSNKDFLNDKLEWKRIQLKRQMIEEQTRQLHVYQEALSYKSELMERIKQVLKQAN